ncbi:MAG: redoxin family protein [Actinomycetota bacterium]|jgi:peroxiredoxin|nr:peroxiredoxin [Acidimicrobiaceae bacterium]MCS5682562.1 redoxin family protein [Acidimicrobiales bacterium]MEC7873105.1 redoxin family protein [Actinomycetota bacterium]MEC8829058.1 redoxin family protein [Actinomycetota bacterium]MEC9338415.1 redoxin family protein [Actinomycetota bacterium]|tara:strand:- start:86 stop:598 length:513 start_codon:yes stop_codon:yes gene_type:complete
MIQVGDQIPDVEVTMLGPDGSPMGVRTGSLLGSGRNILFATPVPFSRGCSNVHLPGYVENAQKLAGGGVSRIACTAVRDPWVMEAFNKAHGSPEVMMIPDGEGDFARALGMDLAGPPGFGVGSMCQRYALVTEDGTVTVVSVEDEPGIMQSSVCEAVIDRLQDTSWWKPI